ncbi:purine-binding chemotaxis protein CheW [Bacillus sp. BGMRC 2118]|nr:purine-binding chemotaxis protein CheW [Bacillus sp. BGMRC 2118]
MMSETLVFDKVVVFQAKEEEFGIPIQYVVSIEKIQALTSIPNMPYYMNGVTTVRGEVTPILDANQILYKLSSKISEQSRMIIVKTDSLSFGIIVDDAKEIIDIPAESVQQVGLLVSDASSYLVGVANLENRLLSLIDPTKLLSTLAEMDDVKKQLQ